MASIRGDKLTIRLQQNSSGTVNKVIAATTSCNVDMSADPLETTSKDDGIDATFMPGKLSGTASGDFLVASDGEQYTNLYTYAGAGDAIVWELYRDGTLYLYGTGYITSISQTGANSDALVTGAYSMDLDVVAQYSGYGPELYTTANAVSDPAGAEADAITGWNPIGLNGTGSNVFESQSSEVNTGSYAFHANSNDTPTALARAYITAPLTNPPLYLVNGDEVKISFSARHVGTGGDWRIGLGAASTGADHAIAELTSSDITWQDYELEFTYDSTYTYFAMCENSATNDGGVYLDNLSFRKKT